MLTVKWGMQMKIKGKINLKNNDEVIMNNKLFTGLKIDNKITYYEDDIKVSLVLGDKISLKRSNDEYELELIFTNKMESKGKYLLKKDNLFLPLYIITDKIIVGNNLIVINYQMDEEKFEFKLEFEVVE